MTYREDLITLLKEWSSVNAGTIYLDGTDDLPKLVSLVNYISVTKANDLQTRYWNYLREVKGNLAVYCDSYYAIDLDSFKPDKYTVKISGGIVDVKI